MNMFCKNCPNATNGDKLGRPVITHPQGNYLQVQIKLKQRTIGVVDGSTVTEDVDPQDVGLVRNPIVILSRGKKEYKYKGEMNGNLVVFEDRGKLPVGTYDITIVFEYGVETPARYKQRTLLQIIDETTDGGQYENDEMNILASYPVLNGVTTAINVGEDNVTISENGKYKGDETPNDDNADISAAYGDESMIVGDDEVTLTL